MIKTKPAPRKKSAPIKPPAPPSSKQDQLKALLSEPEGISVAALSAELGWQAHTTRAALTRLRQAGVKLERLAAEDGARAALYRIAGGRA